ncbi:MAG: hypothetical protein Q9185_004578 [Variospora sp. 1 TL-2023]
MARGRGRTRGTTPRAKGRISTEANGLNTAYRDMLAEAEIESSPSQTGDEGRPIKRRRVRGHLITENKSGPSQQDAPIAAQESPVGEQVIPKQDLNLSSGDEDVENQNGSTVDHPSPRQQQVPYEDQTSEDSEENDFAWEEVELAHEADQPILDPAESDNAQDLDLVLEDDREQPRNQGGTARRKPLTAFEKKMRLEVHKVHFLCLLYHVHLRNHWCNDQDLHKILYRRLPKSIISLLNPNENLPQFRQDESFRQGLEKAITYFRHAFTVTARGMSRAHWVEDPDNIPTQQPPPDLDLPMQKPDFLECAQKMEGSRDVGAQLFCALLRSCGVETRLVCSMQVLPLTSTTKGTMPQKPPPKPIPVVDYSGPSPSTTTTTNPPPPAPSARPIGSTGGLTRFTAPSQPLPHPPPRPQIPKPKSVIPSSPYPIMWLEAYNPYTGKQTPLSPFTSPRPIKNPSTLTPPLSDPHNALTYALAFNADLTARDVTRRYTPSYLSKTLRTRVDATASGKIWLDTVLALFTSPIRTTSADQRAKEENEDTDLALRAAREPMPPALADFLHHPIYALERHLRRHETLRPLAREIGRVSAGAGRPTESVFRRGDVMVCRSAAQWLRLGREIGEGEQPVKRLPPPPSLRRRHQRGKNPSSHVPVSVSVSVSEEEEEENQTQEKALYTEPQTRLYRAPDIPASGSPIPRNAYGTLDIYTPTMVPARGYHSTHPLTRHAARILGLDAVDAVTGFTFGGAAAAETGSSGRRRGRGRGKATITGAVIFGPYREAIAAVIRGLEAERQVAEAEARARVVLGWWRRLGLGLRIRERVRGYEVEGEEEEEEEGGGGFLPEERGVKGDVPTASWRARRRMLLVDDDDDDDDDDKDESEDMDVRVLSNNGDGQVESGPVPITHATREGKRRRVASSDDDDEEEEEEAAGGFIPDDGSGSNGGGGGGFILPDDDQEAGGFLMGKKANHHDDDSSFTTAKTHPTQVEEEEEEPLIAAAKSSAGDKSGIMFPQSSSSSSSPTAEKNAEEAEPITAADEYTSVGEVKLVGHGEEDTSPVHDRPMKGEEAEEEEEEEEEKRDKKEAFELHRTMTDDELEEARMLQELYESGAMDATGHVPLEKLLEQTLDDDDDDGKEQVGDTDEVEGAGLVGAEVDKDSTMPNNEGYDDAETKVADPSSEEEDKGSLISEDPDDEDAEPDWLP